MRVLAEVKRPRSGSTAKEQYARVFLGVYDDLTRRLRYVDGGLNPPVLLGRDPGTAPVRLLPTGGAIGLFEGWKGTVEEVEWA